MIYIKNVVTLEYDKELCTGCGRCTEVCPHGIFEMRDRRAVITDRDRCMECGACSRNCEYGAIQVKAGVGCAQALLQSKISGGDPVCGCGSPGAPAGGACCG